MRNLAWLRRAFAAIDFIYFGEQLKQRGVQIKWFRPPVGKGTFLYGQATLKNGPLEINSVLAHDWVPTNVVLLTIYHEALHILVGEEHSPYFCLLEKQFPNYAESTLWEEQNHAALLKASRPFVRDLR